jgi:hypothetical protein
MKGFENICLSGESKFLELCLIALTFMRKYRKEGGRTKHRNFVADVASQGGLLTNNIYKSPVIIIEKLSHTASGETALLLLIPQP